MMKIENSISLVSNGHILQLRGVSEPIPDRQSSQSHDVDRDPVRIRERIFHHRGDHSCVGNHGLSRGGIELCPHVERNVRVTLPFKRDEARLLNDGVGEVDAGKGGNRKGQAQVEVEVSRRLAFQL